MESVVGAEGGGGIPGLLSLDEVMRSAEVASAFDHL